VKHYLLTRSAYAPTIDSYRNVKRLRITRGVTVRSLKAQTSKDWIWLVLIDLEDPWLPERMAAFLASGVEVIFAPAGDIVRDDAHDKPWGPWAEHIDWSDDTLTTRIDDDDAFAPWVMETYRTKAEDWRKSTRRGGRAVVLALPNGWRYVDGKVNARRDLNSQFASLYVPLADHRTIMDINHTRVRRLARMHIATIKPSWLWVRHDATRSPNSRASRSRWEHMVEPVGMPFEIDWSALA
jgi:hypothetical protein